MVCIANSITDPVKTVCTTGVAWLSLSIYILIFLATQFYDSYDSTFTTLKILVVVLYATSHTPLDCTSAPNGAIRMLRGIKGMGQVEENWMVLDLLPVGSQTGTYLERVLNH